MPIDGTGSDPNRPPDRQDNDSTNGAGGADNGPGVGASDAFESSMQSQGNRDRSDKNSDDAQAQAQGLSQTQSTGKGPDARPDVHDPDIDYGGLSGRPTDAPLGPHTPQTSSQSDLQPGGHLDKPATNVLDVPDPTREPGVITRSEENAVVGIGYKSDRTTGQVSGGATAKAGEWGTVDVAPAYERKVETGVGTGELQAGKLDCKGHGTVSPNVTRVDSEISLECRASTIDYTQKVGDDLSLKASGPNASIGAKYADGPGRLGAGFQANADLVTTGASIDTTLGPVNAKASIECGIGAGVRGQIDVVSTPDTVGGSTAAGLKAGIGCSGSVGVTIDKNAVNDWMDSIAGGPQLETGGALDAGQLGIETDLRSDFDAAEGAV